MNAPKMLPVMLLGMTFLIGCERGVSERPCPRVTEFPKPLLTAAAAEIEGRPAIAEVMRGLSADRAYNREVCAAP